MLFTVKNIVKELIKMYSNVPSFFSKKRIESGISFIVAQMGMLIWLFKHINTMDYIEIIAWATTEFTISGYMIKKIQEEKATNNEKQP